MVEVVYILPNGERKTINANEGQSVMDAALENSVRGILGECGGTCSCATCHVYIEESPAPVGEPEGFESELLDGTASERLPNSRLSCQVSLTSELSGIVVRIPANQV